MGSCLLGTCITRCFPSIRWLFYWFSYPCMSLPFDCFITNRYFVIAVTFAAIYFQFSPHDDRVTSLKTFGHAFIASLQIQSTIGFATPVQDHWSTKPGLIVAVTIHGLTTVIFNIFLLGTLFARMSSAKNRAISVRVSSLAVVRDFGPSNYPCLEFRVGEIRKHQLMNLEVSAYLFTHKGEKLFARDRLTLDPPEGVFLAVPTELRHTINETSPFWSFLSKEESKLTTFDCPVCGDKFDSRASLIKHVSYVAESPTENGHKEALKTIASLVAPSLGAVKSALQSFAAQYWEIIVLVEGTEPVTGSPIQVRHSFLLRDVHIGATFERCWSVETTENGTKKIVVDFSAFDKLATNDSINP